MIPIAIEITQTREEAGLSVRAWRKVLKTAHETQGKHWLRHMLPKHFTPAARSLYSHQQRRRNYLAAKRRAAAAGIALEGGLVDLVYTGRMREYMTTTARVDAYPTRATIRMASPRYMTMIPLDPRRPNKAREVLALTAAERAELTDLLRRTLDNEIDAYYLNIGSETFPAEARTYTGGPAAGYSTADFLGD